MLRIVGAVMILGGCLGLGCRYRAVYHIRLHNLKIMKEILEQFYSEIAYGKRTLPECCRRVGESRKEPFGTAFLEIYKKTGKCGEHHFGQVFNEVAESCLRDAYITEAERNIFMEFVRTEGVQDGRMQLQMIENSREQLQKRIEMLERENKEKCNLAVALGFMGGLFLVLIMI